MAKSIEGLPIRLRGTTNIYDTVVPPGPATLGVGKPVFRSTSVQTAQDRAHLHQFDMDRIPNLVQMRFDN